MDTEMTISGSFLHDTYVRKVMPGVCLHDDARVLQTTSTVQLTKRTDLGNPETNQYDLCSPECDTKLRIRKVTDATEQSPPGGEDVIVVQLADKSSTGVEGYTAAVCCPGGNTVGYADRYHNGAKVLNKNEEVILLLQPSPRRQSRAMRCLHGGKISYEMYDEHNSQLNGSMTIQHRSSTVKIHFGRKQKLLHRVALIGAALLLLDN